MDYNQVINYLENKYGQNSDGLTLESLKSDLSYLKNKTLINDDEINMDNLELYESISFIV